jgi:hypothetical protein
VSGKIVHFGYGTLSGTNNTNVNKDYPTNGMWQTGSLGVGKKMGSCGERACGSNKDGTPNNNDPITGYNGYTSPKFDIPSNKPDNFGTKKYCRSTLVKDTTPSDASDKAFGGTSTGNSDKICVNVLRSYKIPLEVKADKEEITRGESVTFNYPIENKGPHKGEFGYIVRQFFFVPDGQAIPDSKAYYESNISSQRCTPSQAVKNAKLWNYRWDKCGDSAKTDTPATAATTLIEMSPAGSNLGQITFQTDGTSMSKDTNMRRTVWNGSSWVRNNYDKIGDRVVDISSMPDVPGKLCSYIFVTPSISSDQSGTGTTNANKRYAFSNTKCVTIKPNWKVTPTVQIKDSKTNTTFGTRDLTIKPLDTSKITVTWKHGTTLEHDPPRQQWWAMEGTSNTITRNSNNTKGGTWYTTQTTNEETTWEVDKPAHNTKTCRFTRVSYPSVKEATEKKDGNSAVLCATVQYDWYIDFTNNRGLDVGSTVGYLDRSPSSIITWTHKARQAGPTISDKTVKFTINHTNGWIGSASPNKMSNFNPNQYRPADARNTLITISDNDTKKILQADVNKTLCSNIIANPGGGGLQTSTARSSANACVFIPYNYQLKPDTKIATPGQNGDAGTINYDDPIYFQATIPNDGPTKSKTTNWQAFTFVIPRTVPRTTIPGYKQNVAPVTSNVAGVNAVYSLTDTRNYQTIGTKGSIGRCTYKGEPSSHSKNEIFYPSQRNTEDSKDTNSLIVCKTDDLVDLVSSLSLGDRLCFALWVSPSWAQPDNPSTPQDEQNPPNNRSYSQPSCLTVAKSPQLQLRGADSKSGAKQFGKTTLTTNNQGGFEGSASSNPERGSWSQYGLLAHGSNPITSFGSTGYTTAYATPPVSGSSTKPFCKLLFANTDGNGTSSCKGDATTEKYGQLNTEGRIISLPKVAELKKTDFQNLASDVQNHVTKLNSSTVSLTGRASGTYYYDVTAADMDLGGNLAPGQHIVIVVPTDNHHSITITGNITDNSATYTSLAQIPSLTVIADDIYVPGEIKQLFGTYIARNGFNTCNNPTISAQAGFNPDGFSQTLAGADNAASQPGGKPWSGICRQQLTITGAVISKNRPNFLRTAGAGKDDTTTPAEILNYTPNSYLTPYALNHTDSQNNWTLTDVRQLPARL